MAKKKKKSGTGSKMNKKDFAYSSTLILHDVPEDIKTRPIAMPLDIFSIFKKVNIFQNFQKSLNWYN